MREAEFFQKIIREIRVESEYFMVGYYGKGFPLLLRVSCHGVSISPWISVCVVPAEQSLHPPREAV